MSNNLFPSKNASYFFTRAKATHEEDGSVFITLFVRLTRETNVETAESLWADIKEVRIEEASPKMKRIPDHMHKYEIPESVFKELYSLSFTSPEDLYCMTPIHLIDTFKKHG